MASQKSTSTPNQENRDQMESSKNFFLGKIAKHDIWMRDLSKTSTTHQSWLPSTHCTTMINVTKIKAFLNKPQNIKLDSTCSISIPNSFVRCGQDEYKVALFELDELKQTITIHWSPTPKKEVIEIKEMLEVKPTTPATTSTSSNQQAATSEASTGIRAPKKPNSTGRHLYWETEPIQPNLEGLSGRVEKLEDKLVPTNDHTGIQFSRPPNPRGRFFFWEDPKPAVPTREDINRKIDQIEDRVADFVDLKSTAVKIRAELELLKNETTSSLKTLPKADLSPKLEDAQSQPLSALTAVAKSKAKFHLGEIASDGIWLRDIPNSTKDRQAWLPSEHSSSKINMASIFTYLKKAKKSENLDHEIAIPGAYVTCGSMMHAVSSFYIDESQKKILIHWESTPKSEVIEMSPETAGQSPTPAAPPSQKSTIVRSSANSANIHASSQLNPRGRHMYWISEAVVPTQMELADKITQIEEQVKKIEELRNVIRKLQDELKELRTN